jgi:hypothetical protein
MQKSITKGALGREFLCVLLYVDSVFKCRHKQSVLVLIACHPLASCISLNGL